MTSVEARSTVRYEFGGTVTGPDGYSMSFVMDDSFKSWLAIAKWNLHYRHWRALAGNARDLFGKVLWRKLCRPR